jgi:hypothetical protein
MLQAEMRALIEMAGDAACPRCANSDCWAARACRKSSASPPIATELSALECGFLYDGARHLLAIGYNVSEHRLDPGYYDLLASEARFASFVAIAQGALPQESWFALGRLVAASGGRPVLLSWSGSMFEYLMPLLVMPAYERTLLGETYRAVVERQVAYGRQRGVPWGISECGYNAVDAGMNYQYRAFGVPGLGSMRGLADDLVVAPMRRRWRSWSHPRRPARTCSAWPRKGSRAASACTRRSTSRRHACPAASRAWWCVRSWRTTRR